MQRNLDELDRRLIAMLRHDARAPVSSLALALGVSRATVKARIDRLVAEGTIKAFTVVLAEEVGTQAVRAIMSIEVEGRTTDRVVRQLRGFPEVRALHTTNGRWDLVAELEAPSLEAFDETLRRVRLIESIGVTETSLLLATRFRTAAGAS